MTLPLLAWTPHRVLEHGSLIGKSIHHRHVEIRCMLFRQHYFWTIM